jgi:cytochrome c peroxidase
MKKTIVLCFIAFVVCSFYLNELPSKKIKTKAQLGKLLFEEKILSLDSSVSCASCHIPTLAFADTAKFSKGINGKLTTRNTPSVLNMLNRSAFFWDGRAETLEQQALMPIENKNEMGLPIAEAVKRLNNNKTYFSLFKRVFKAAPNKENLAAALAAFERTLETVDSKFDDWTNNLRKYWSASEERGRALFVGQKAKCFNCHMAEDFTNDDYKNIGTYNAQDLNDEGRFSISKNKADVGKFKTPGLRNIAVTAPYMHNGMFATLEEVLAYYNNPKAKIHNAINIDDDLNKPLELTAQEQQDIIAFLKTLTDKKYVK